MGTSVSALCRWDSCELDAQAVGNALYGLQSLTDSPELRGLVAALAYKVELPTQHTFVCWMDGREVVRKCTRRFVLHTLESHPSRAPMYHRVFLFLSQCQKCLQRKASVLHVLHRVKTFIMLYTLTRSVKMCVCTELFFVPHLACGRQG